MPYEWRTIGEARHLRLWQYRSLPARGFVWFIGVTAAFLALPLIALLGTKFLWVFLPFILAAVAAIWIAIRANNRARSVTENLTLDRDRAHLLRRNPDGSIQEWQANSHWVRVALYPKDGPVPDYLTLASNEREVELGAFLSADERRDLARELRQALAALR